MSNIAARSLAVANSRWRRVADATFVGMQKACLEKDELKVKLEQLQSETSQQAEYILILQNRCDGLQEFNSLCRAEIAVLKTENIKLMVAISKITGE